MTVKRFLVLCLAICLTIGMTAAFAEETEEIIVTPEPTPEIDTGRDDHLYVGTTGHLTGMFFSDLWNYNSSDLDVRQLLEGYYLTWWDNTMGFFYPDERIAVAAYAIDEENGDRTYEFHLNQNLKFSDGSPITAWHYAFTILFSASPEIGEIGAETDTLKYIRGVEEYQDEEDPAKTISGVRVEDDYTISITIRDEYTPYFFEMGLLSFCPYPMEEIVPGCEIADEGEGIHWKEPEKFTAELVKESLFGERNYMGCPDITAGPYAMLDYDGEKVELQRNEYFIGDEDNVQPQIEYITFTTAKNEDLIPKLEDGTFDLVERCVKADTIDAGIALAAGGTGFQMGNYPRTGLSMLSFCCEQGPVKSEKVRQAIAYCLDKDAFVEEYVGNYGVRVDGYYGVGQWMYNFVSDPTNNYLAEPGEDATTAEMVAYEKELVRWSALSMDDIPVYNLNVDTAVELLEKDGWTLNEDGEEFNPEEDAFRCRKGEDGEMEKLDLTLVYPEDTEIAENLEKNLIAHLKEAGIQLTLETMDTETFFDTYYRAVERDCDMMFVASNFMNVFDPAWTFSPEDASQGLANRTAIEDEVLYDAAFYMSSTEPYDVYEYCRRWISFQREFQRAVPAISLYSNLYFDFYTSRLQNYDPGSGVTWGESIVMDAAYLSGEAAAQPTPTPTPAEEDEEDIFE